MLGKFNPWGAEPAKSQAELLDDKQKLQAYLHAPHSKNQRGVHSRDHVRALLTEIDRQLR